MMEKQWRHLQKAWGRHDASKVDTRNDTLELRPRLQYYRPYGLEDYVRFCTHTVVLYTDRVGG